MDFREYAVVRENDEIRILGTIREPVHWDFSIRVCEDDISGMTRLLFNRGMLGLLLRSVFRRRKRHHWSGSLEEHLSQTAERRAANLERFSSGAEAQLDPASARRRTARKLATPSVTTAEGAPTS